MGVIWKTFIFKYLSFYFTQYFHHWYKKMNIFNDDPQYLLTDYFFGLCNRRCDVKFGSQYSINTTSCDKSSRFSNSTNKKNFWVNKNKKHLILHNTLRGDRDCMVIGFITTLAISANYHESCEFEPLHGEVYSIQHYVIKFVSDLRQVGGFLQVLRFPPPIKLTATIWLKYRWKWH